MTDATQAPDTQTAGPGGIAVIGAIAVLVLAALWYFGGADRALNKSAVGFDGLISWTRDQGIASRRFTGGGFLVRGKVGLRILPLHDVNLHAEMEHPKTRDAVLAQMSEKDIDWDTVHEKVGLLPTLVILPKWRAGMHKLGVAHKTFLIDQGALNGLIGNIPGLKGQIRRDPQGYARSRAAPYGDQEIALMHEQTIKGSGCVPLIGTEQAMLLGRCKITGTGAEPDGSDDTEAPRTFWVLADPDLMNNHGLALGANAALASSFLSDFASAERPVVLDLTTETMTLTKDWNADAHERTWADVLRMFRWPFTMIWIAFGLLSLLVLWRAIVRAGPLARLFEDNPTASKEAAIDAKARLLRLANHDTALLASHISARLAHLAAEIFGPHLPPDRTPLAALIRLIDPRNPDLADELDTASDLPDLQGQTSAEILSRLDRFEICYNKVMHEFGRAPDTR